MSIWICGATPNTACFLSIPNGVADLSRLTAPKGTSHGCVNGFAACMTLCCRWDYSFPSIKPGQPSRNSSRRMANFRRVSSGSQTVIFHQTPFPIREIRRESGSRIEHPQARFRHAEKRSISFGQSLQREFCAIAGGTGAGRRLMRDPAEGRCRAIDGPGRVATCPGAKAATSGR